MKQLISITLLAASISAFAQSDNSALYEKALASFQGNKINEAEIHIKNILKSDNQHLPARLLFAEVLIAKGNGSAAQVELEFAKSQGVDIKKVIPLLTEAHLLQNNFNQALSLSETSIDDTRVQAQLLVLKGQALLGLRQLIAAEKAFDQALFLKSNFQKALLGRAQVSIARGRLEESLGFIDKAIDSYIPSANAWLLKASVFEKLGRFDESLFAINKATEIEPDNFLARLTRATILINDGNYEQAEKDINRVLERIPNEPRAKYLNAVLMAYSGKFEKSSQALSEVINTISAVPEEVLKSTPGYYYLAGQANYTYQNYNEARRYLEEFLKYQPDDLQTIKMLAVIDLTTGEFLSALRILTKANLTEPNNPNILSLLGATHRELGNLSKSIFYYEQVAKLVPQSALPITDIAKTKLRQGKYREVIEQLSTLNVNDVDPLEINLLLVDSYMGNKQFAKAKNIIEQLSISEPNNTYLLLQLARINGALGEIDAAKNLFKQILTIEPDHTDARIHLLRLDAVEGKHQLALNKIDQYIAQDDKNPLYVAEKAHVLLMLEQLDEATRFFEKAYLLDKTNENLLTDLIAAHNTNKNYERSVDLLDEFLDRFKDSEKALKLLADVYRQQNQLDKAIAVQLEVIKVARNKGKAHVDLGELFLAMGNKTDAMRSFNRAMAWDENYDAGYIHTVQLAIDNNDFEQANDTISLLEKTGSNETVGQLLRADVLIAQKQFKNAKSILIKSLNQTPSQRSLIKLTQVLIALEEHSLAKEYLSNWLKNNANDILVEMTFADLLHHNKEIDAAKKVYLALIQKYPTSGILMNNAAAFFVDIVDKEKSLEIALKANELVPQNINVIDTLASAYSLNDDDNNALALYRNALLIDFANPKINYKIALTLHKLGRNAEAKKHLIEAVESNIDFNDKTQARELLTQWMNNK